MAESMKSTHDFIKSAYAICVGILSSQDAEIVSKRNNLSFTELIQPFCTLTNEAKIQGINAQSYRAYNINVRVSDIRQNPVSIENRAVRQQISDLISKSGAMETMQKLVISSPQCDLTVNRTCPWMDTYKDLVIKLGPPQSHEFLSHRVACMLIVSSSHPNPMQEFSNLSQLQNRIQHGEKSNESCKWMTPNTLKYFVLLHDVQQSDETKAREVFSSLQATYGSKVCHFLRLNSRSVTTTETGMNLPDPWHHFMNMSINASSDEDNSRLKISSTNDEQNQSWFSDLQKSSMSEIGNGYGCCLTMADHDGLQSFMQDFIVGALLPHIEKTIKNINDQLSARKGLHKSLFRATRTLFGSNKSNVSVNSGYSHDANELLLRKLADLCFLSQMYDQAFYFYHNARKDYMNDQAWLYAAGASEMAAISNFMQHNAQKSYPVHYMESAITTYIDVCKNNYLAFRCALIHADCLQRLGMFSEAAFYMIKITNETDDLRSALLLEQAAHCYLKMKEVQPKKFAFHLILAGHRFSKCAQRNHALRSYSLSLQVYQGQGWSLAEDHINFALARQSFNLKKLMDASNFFRSLLLDRSSQPVSQQAAFFHEFIHIFQQYQSLNKSKTEYAALGLPKLLNDDTRVFLEQDDLDQSSILDAKMLQLENILYDVEGINDSDLVGGVKCFTKFTANNQSPVIAVGEEIKVHIVFENYLDISLCLSDITIQWQFIPPDREISEDAASDIAFKCTSVSFVTVLPLAKTTIEFTLSPLKPGEINAQGIVYNLGLLVSDGPDVQTALDITYTVRDYQSFNIVGKRLNKTKDEKTSVMYDTDKRLSFRVQPVLPMLTAIFRDFPASLACNEVINATLSLKNTGNVKLDTVKVFAGDDVQFTISGSNYKCVLPNVKVDKSGIINKCNPNLLVEPLQPGSVIDLPVSLKAPASNGQHRADTLFYCQSDSILNGPTSRTFFVKNCVDCKTYVVISSDLVAPIDQNCSIVSLQVKNMCDLKGWLLYTKDVTCANSQYLVEVLGERIFPALVQNNILSLYLKVTNLHADCTSNSPQIIVHWKGSCDSVNREMQGRQHIDVGEVFNGSNMLSQNSINDNEEYSLQSLHRLLTWRLSYNIQKEHDFAAHGSCYVDLTLMLFNLSDLRLLVTVSVSHLEDSFNQHLSQTDFAWIGTTEAIRLVEPHSEIELKLKACFFRQGVFNISGVNVTAVPEHMKGKTPQIPQKPPCGYFITIV